MCYGVSIVKNILRNRLAVAMYIAVLKSCILIFDLLQTFLKVKIIYDRKRKKERIHDDAVKRGDAYIDKLLKDMFKERIEEYDPYKIQDSAIGLNRTVIFVDVTAEAKLHDCYITGLKTLTRVDHCALKEENEKLHVEADLGAGVLKLHYSVSVKFMNCGPTITVHGNIDYVEVNFEFTVNAKTGKRGKLSKFVIHDMRGMEVWITGLGPLNWAVNPIIRGVTKIFKGRVGQFLQNKVRNRVARNMQNFQFPIERIDTDETIAPKTLSCDVLETLSKMAEPGVEQMEQFQEAEAVEEQYEKTEKPEIEQTKQPEETEKVEQAEQPQENGEVEQAEQPQEAEVVEQSEQPQEAEVVEQAEQPEETEEAEQAEQSKDPEIDQMETSQESEVEQKNQRKRRSQRSIRRNIQWKPMILK